MAHSHLGHATRRIRLFHFNPWADRLEGADTFLNRLPEIDITARVSKSDDASLVRAAKLDCDWYGQITRTLDVMRHPLLEFLPTRVFGIPGLLELAKSTRPPDEEWWLFFGGQTPQKLAGALGKLLPFLARSGVRVLYYAFDEASYTMPCFAEIAPHLNILIHDESPLNPGGSATLNRSCSTICRSWVANLIPFIVPFHEQPEEKILFLGSQLGLTDHRRSQFEFLKKKFGDRFLAIHDHSVDVATLGNLNRFKVSLCPEGRKFGTPAMSTNHTDRPFWSGCLGMVPVSENSKNGGRLEELSTLGLIERYEHGDLASLAAACERALATPVDHRRKIYDHFNRRETIGTVVAEAVAAAAAKSR